MNTFLRGLGYFLCVCAFALVAIDAWKMVQSSSFIITPIGQYWYELSATTLNLAQAVVERYIWKTLWDPIILTFLLCPAFLLFAIPGGVLLYFTRPFSVGKFHYEEIFS